MLQEFDRIVVQWANGFARRWPAFDRLVLDVLQLPSLKLLPVVGCLIWLWHSDSGDGSRRRAVVDAMVGGCLALVVTRLVQNLSPHRPRPGLSGDFEFVLPIGGYTNDWSSFPSDTAGLAFALVAGVWCGWPRLGVAAAVWATVIVCFPRLYGGFHYPSDMLAGAVIGLASTLLVSRFLPGRELLFQAVLRLSCRHRPLFYTLAFVAAFQITTYFVDIWQMLSGALAEIGIVRLSP